MNTVRIANALKKLGVDVHIAVSRPDGSYTELLESSIKIHNLTDGLQMSSTLTLLQSILPLARLVRKIRPNVVCPVMISSGYVVGAGSILFPRRTKIYLSVQNTLRPPLQPRLQKIIVGVLNHFLFRGFDQFVALSRGVAQDLVDLLPFAAGRTTIINNAGVEGMVAKRPPLRTTKQSLTSITFITCGRLTQQKGYPVLLEAFAAVCRQCEARLVILGDGPLRAQLLELTERLGIQDRVEFAGFVRDPLNWFSKADVFVLASLWEGFANVIVEAMSTGLPVVSTDCPHGPGEIIANGVNGLLVEPADVAGLAKAMMAMAKNPSLREALGEKGFERSNDFTSEAIAESWLAILRR
ncbi:RfaG Glycosyltransferase [Sphingomonadaceae bacterium]